VTERNRIVRDKPHDATNARVLKSRTQKPLNLLNLELLNVRRRLYFPRVPLAVPYWNAATYRSILRCFLSGRIIDGPDFGKLRSQLIETLSVADAVLCGSGSLALELALRACGVREGDEVVLPTFCCTALVAPVLSVGAIPVLADVGDELNMSAATVAAVLSKKTKAIIVPHLFGNPANINAIVDLAHGRGIGVIDDAAQALGATIDGRWVGSFGDVGILSFGSEKVCFGLGGGVVVGRDQAFPRSGIGLAPALLAPALRRLLSTLIWRRWRRWTQPVRAALSGNKRAGPEAPPELYRQETMANLNAAVAFSLVQTLRENIAARRARVRAYHELLGAEERLTLMPHQPGSACLTQVVRVLAMRHGEDMSAQLVEVLGGAGFEIQGSYVPIHLLADYQHLARRPLPHAEGIWADLIELPCEPEVSMNDVERIAAMVKQVVAAG
jgi:perosamine synthetase